ncbi:MAG: hypothetical protein SGPRY_013679 [Prymnesium sp.]
MATTVDTAWSSSDLARQVCDVLVADGRLKEKPAFIRADREKKICGVFEAARLDGSVMATMTGRAVEVAVRNATQGEAWVDDVQRVLKGMMSEEQAAKTDGVAESDEMKLLREKMALAALPTSAAEVAVSVSAVESSATNHASAQIVVREVAASSLVVGEDVNATTAGKSAISRATAPSHVKAASEAVGANATTVGSLDTKLGTVQRSGTMAIVVEAITTLGSSVVAEIASMGAGAETPTMEAMAIAGKGSVAVATLAAIVPI